MDEVVREFLLETHENLAQLDLDLVKLETDASDAETISRVFRTLHTVKGTAGFLGLPKLQAVGHAAENLLSKLRSNERAYSPDIASALLAAVDAIRVMLVALENTGSEGDDDHAAVLATLEQLTTSPAPVAVTPAKPKASESRPPPQPKPPPTPAPRPASPPEPPPAPSLIVPPKPAAVSLAMDPPRPLPTTSVDIPPAQATAPAVADTALRVDVGLLDKLMTLVGELVLARNQLVRFGATQDDSGFTGSIQRLNVLTTELQANVMKTRMQPIGQMWGKFPRVVRDLSVACGKQVRFDMFGKDTELDKSIVEAIRDPLTHLVRNAVDHGIETPAVRVASGKPAEGHLVLSASHEGGKVIVTLADNGKGIDLASVRNKALAANLITPDQANRMSEREILELIFLPGFSTADKVTHFSGRGVGMDVVRTNVETIGGTVDVHSTAGQGTTITMTIPLTLAIIPALIVSSAGDSYAIPQLNLIELVRLASDEAKKGIDRIPGAEVYRLREQLLPVIRLSRILELEGGPADPQGDIFIVVLQADARPFGLIVDAIHDTEEIVVKPLQKQVKEISLFSGATIRGDGRVALILDILGVAQRANVIQGVRNRTLAESTVVPAVLPRQQILLVTSSEGDRLALPLDVVSRFEEFPRSSVERIGSQLAVQYRGQILPLWDVTTLLNPVHRKDVDSMMVRVVVCQHRGRPVGLIVERIVDIVDDAIESQSASHRFGIQFAAVIRERITEFLDLDQLIPADTATERRGG